jgi:hypothetical protein
MATPFNSRPLSAQVYKLTTNDSNDIHSIIQQVDIGCDQGNKTRKDLKWKIFKQPHCRLAERPLDWLWAHLVHGQQVVCLPLEQLCLLVLLRCPPA